MNSSPKLNEISVGTQYVYDNRLVRIIEYDTVIGEYRVTDNNGILVKSEELLPISLTSKILVIYGFEFELGVTYKYYNHGNECIIRLNIIDDYYYHEEYGDVRYLHQLQNLLIQKLGSIPFPLSEISVL